MAKKTKPPVDPIAAEVRKHERRIAKWRQQAQEIFDASQMQVAKINAQCEISRQIIRRLTAKPV